MSPIPKSLGKSIQEARKQYHYTQAVLSEKVDISLRHMQQIEYGNNLPGLGTMYRIAKILNLSIDDALFPERTEKSDAYTRLTQRAALCTDYEIEIAIGTIETLLQQRDKAHEVVDIVNRREGEEEKG